MNAPLPKPRSFFEMVKSHPAGFWFIFWGELAERCSYYGMMSILARFISEALELGDAAGNNWVSYFKAACYFMPLVGGFLADNYLGKYRLIIIFSIPYILGHVVLAGETMTWTLIALALLAAGSGAIKPNISTLMGMTYDQKRPGDDALRTLAFGMFYMAINIGAAVSYAVLPVIRDQYGYSIAFLCPAVLMAVSFLLFAVGKPFYATEVIQRHASTPAERAEKWITIKRIAGLFLLITFFWAIFDQSHTTWIFFARDFTDLKLGSYLMSPEQIGVLNPILIVLFIPLMTVMWARLEPRGIKPRATDKIMLGFILTAFTMLIMSVAGYMAGQYEEVPAVKGKTEQDPYIITTPKVDRDAIRKFQKENNVETAPPLEGITKAQLVWIAKKEKPTVTEEANKAIVSWGSGANEKVEFTWTDAAAKPKVEHREENGVEVTSTAPFTVTFTGKAGAAMKRLVPANQKVTLWWEVLAFITLTLAEVLISVTGLELAFVVSPVSMKSFVTALWLLTVGIANLFINAQVGGVYNTLTPGNYFAFLVGLMILVIVVFVFVAKSFNAMAADQDALAKKVAEGA